MTSNNVSTANTDSGSTIGALFYGHYDVNEKLTLLPGLAYFKVGSAEGINAVNFDSASVIEVLFGVRMKF